MSIPVRYINRHKSDESSFSKGSKWIKFGARRWIAPSYASCPPRLQPWQTSLGAPSWKMGSKTILRQFMFTAGISVPSRCWICYYLNHENEGGRKVLTVARRKQVCSNVQDSFLVPILAEHGFQYHTTTAKELTMTRWLPDTPSELSQRGLNHHSVIGVVLDKDGRILMIQERRR
ncbi:hypothetical protein Y032_0161g3393 [Ancylostoma ceylanicum]|uniref:Pre-nudix hydrolase domain-containing protein n=1 Tax=Ancylostoma ceylanicum TaxID=53326 RepID=A0A016SY16_9BILA|nr:hypothetical protein Y032_0161g3393 [Ancylostoma ceylanicum]